MRLSAPCYFRLFVLGLGLATPAIFSACASDADSNGARPAGPGDAPGGDLFLPGKGSDCSTPEQGCACADEGAQVPCADKKSEGGGFVQCSHGTRGCQGGRWGACEPTGQMTSIKAPALDPELQAQGLGPSTKCINNPCNPYCQGYKDDYIGLQFAPDSGLQQADGGTPGVTLTPDPNGKPGDQVTGFRIAPKPKVVVKVKQMPLGQYPEVDSAPQFTAEFLCDPTTPTCNPTKPTAASWSLSSYQNVLINSQGQVSVIKPVPSSVIVTGKAGGFADQSSVVVEVDVVQGAAASPSVINSFAVANQNPAALPLDDFSWLYPYKNTLFPRGLTAPIAQTDYGSLSNALVKYTIRHRRPDSTVDFSWSTISTQTAPPRYTVPQHVWQYFDETASGQGAELVIQRAGSFSCGAPPACQDRFYGGKIYRFCTAGYDWNTARGQCTAMGMDLAKIESSAENTFVGSTATSIAAGSWWIGIHDQVSEGQFRWADGSAVPYANWNPGEPNNYGGSEDCGELYTGSHVWNDLPCSYGRYFVCEGSNTASCTVSQIRREVVLPIRFSPEPMQGTVYFWEINNGRIAKILDDGTLVQNFLAVPGGRCLACHTVSADGSTLVAQIDGGNGNGTTFNASTGGFTYERGGANQIMAVSPDGYWTLWNDWGVLSPSNSGARPSWTYGKGVMPDSQGRLVAPAWSPDGKWIAWTRWDSGSWYVDFTYGNLYITPFNDLRPIDVYDDGNCASRSWGGHLYHFCSLSWDRNSARNYCTGKGAGWDLARIDDGTENEAVRSLAYGVAQGSWWIGAHDQASEGQFRWADGSLMPFTYWNSGEPNNSGGNEDCAEMFTSNGRWNDLGCGAGRYFVCERNPDSWNYFGNNTTAATPVGSYDTAVYPSFSPDSNYVIFQRANAVRTRGNYGQLWLLNRANVAQQVLLGNANTPTSMNPSGLASAVPGQNEIAYEPTFSPTESGGYYWAVFVSNRTYGNTIHPSLGDVRPNASYHLKDSGKKQMWVTAIPKNPNMLADPSSPPFWLPGQQINNENMRGYFAKSPCKQTNQACKWDEDCCGFSGGTALCVLDQPVTPAATRHCGAFTPGQCVSTGGSCSDSSQCCKSPDVLECIQGVCKLPVPTPFYSPTPYDRDYEGTCPSGTRVVWRTFSWKGVTPGDSSIVASVKTGETAAELDAAPWTSLIELPAAQCMAGYKCGDVTTSFKAETPPVVSRSKLRVRMVLNPTSDNSAPPTLTDWKQEYDCFPSE